LRNGTKNIISERLQKGHDIVSLYDDLLNGETKLSVVGLGYVGMPIAVAFAKKIKVVGFDLNKQKIERYKAGIDPTREIGSEVIKNSTVDFTADETKLREAKFHIVAVPTPVNQDKTPDLSPVEGASKILGRNLTKGSIVVYESTVYPGVTEDICIPILEKESGLKCGVDFKIGQMAGIDVPEGTKAIVSVTHGIGKDEVLAKEKLFPVLGLFLYDKWEDAVEIARTNLEMEGLGHSVVIHSNNKEHIEYVPTRVNVSRYAVNQVGGTALGGALDNFLNPTTTLGCGTWGNNSISENLWFYNLMNVSRIAYRIADAKIPTDEEIWAE